MSVDVFAGGEVALYARDPSRTSSAQDAGGSGGNGDSLGMTGNRG